MATELPYFVNRKTKAEQAVFDAIEEKNRAENLPTPANTIRMSSIGRCPREIWAGKHDIPEERPFPPRMLAVFKLGHTIEEMVVEQLNDAGFVVSDQQRTVDIELSGGRLVGHIDGTLTERGTKHLLEIKSANDNRFQDLSDRPQLRGYQQWGGGAYTGQLHAYMGGLGLASAWVVVLNKNSSELYIEEIPFDRDRFFALLVKAQDILDAKDIPDRPPEATSVGCKLCRYCTFSGWCYGPTLGVEFDE